MLFMQSFHISNIYRLVDSTEMSNFITWLYNFDTSNIEDWLILGDFNLIRSPLNRSRLGENVNEMLLFNDLIQHLDLVEISF
jgi:hypothetical protein